MARLLITLLAIATASAACSAADAGDTMPPPQVQDELRAILESPDSEELARQTAAYERESEDSMALCMIAEGFEYIPAIAGKSPIQPRVDLTDLSADDFAALYGFGWSTLIDVNPLGLLADEIGDPNQLILDDLSEIEREAYGAQLGDCRDEVSQALPPPPGAVLTSVDTNAILEEIEIRIASDSRYIEAIEQWQQCMSSQGYRYASLEELYDNLAEDVQPYLDAYTARWNELAAQLDYDSIAALRIEDVLDPAQLLKLAALQESEIDLAVTHLHCETGITEIHDELYKELTAELIE